MTRDMKPNRHPPPRVPVPVPVPVYVHVPVHVLQSRCYHCQFHYCLFHAHVPFPAAVLVLVLGSPPITKDRGI
ncbi:hypothetical protein N7516_000674 [Penicillium verrucosum]|uniref:uncharacterized protein n=1 Tax=Penicillium verrucosum TaxID=60171 RepID=UPI002545B8D5|nr:uncharacterized protein N7516_000674 [Penicillium verrucosum]KAJ5940506.1 hypothetical protein N7516_000674 [Penicillium verrucosum]